MKRRIRILRRAAADIAEIRDYIETDSPEAADRVVEELLSGIERLGDFPFLGPVPRDERLRRLGYRVLIRGRYLIFYKIVGSQVRVYRVLHQRREYERIL